MTDRGLDLLVVGGGPAGLATAINAALAGLEVAVLEPRPVPIDKACGEGLMPGASEMLTERLGATVTGRPFRGIAYLDHQHCVRAAFSAGPGLGVRRTVLHTALVERAIALGVPTHPVRVDRIRQTGDRVEATGPGSPTFTARYLAAADGLHSTVRRALGGIDRSTIDRRRRGPARYGLRRHYAIAPWSDFVEVYWSTDAEAYVTPVAEDLVGVAVLTTERSGFDAQLSKFPGLCDRIAESGPDPPADADAGPVRGAGPMLQPVGRRVSGRVLLVGDAAGYLDAITGEGLAVAFAAADELVRCVTSGRPEDYDTAWRRVSRRHRVLTGGLLRLRRHRTVANAIVPAAAKFPRLFGRAVDLLA